MYKGSKDIQHMKGLIHINNPNMGNIAVDNNQLFMRQLVQSISQAKLTNLARNRLRTINLVSAYTTNAFIMKISIA